VPANLIRLGEALLTHAFAEKVVLLALRLHTPGSEDLDWFELFSGSANNTKAVRKLTRNFKCATFDIKDSPGEDFCSASGLLWVALVILRLKPRSTFWAAPVCSTWILMALSHTRRYCPDYAGSVDRLDVRTANFTAHTMIAI
jgi:hypothetical protein